MPFFHLSPEDDRKVRTRVAERIAERSQANFEVEFPGLEELTGRELLAWLEQTDDQYWIDLASKYPDEAQDLIRKWARLIERYRGGESYAPKVRQEPEGY